VDESSELRKILVEIVGEIAGYLRDLVDSNELYRVIGKGASGDQTRLADKIAEEMVIDLIKREHLCALIVSEEIGLVKTCDRPEYVVIIDPLDGSMNYISKITFASSSIAIAHVEKPYYREILAGAVANIFLREIYSFDKNNAYLDNIKIDPNTLKPVIRDTIVIYTSRPELFYSTKVFMRKYMPHGRLRILGSASLEICYVGLGRIGLYINDTGKLRNLDIAAASLFAEKLGKKVVDITGRSIDFRVDRIEKISTIIVGDDEIVSSITSVLKETGYVQTP